MEALRQKLEEWERSTGGQKAIVFMRERVACRLLGEELGCEWIVADGGGRGGGASSTFGLVRQTAEDHHRALARFRSDACRVLVATQVLAEGIDVPECQLVVGFDAPDTSRELTQWRGRARAAEPRYLHMAANGDGGAHIVRLQRLAEATHRAAAAWDLGSAPASFDWPTSDAIVEAETGATMPEEEAKSYLHSRVYEMSFGDGEIDLSEKHFSERNNFWMSEPDAAGAYSCTVLLEPVLLCEVKTEVDGDDLVVVEGGEAVRRAPRRVSSGACSTKDAAMAAAALAGCRTLRKLGSSRRAPARRRPRATAPRASCGSPSTDALDAARQRLRARREGGPRALASALPHPPPPTDGGPSGGCTG